MLFSISNAFWKTSALLCMCRSLESTKPNFSLIRITFEEGQGWNASFALFYDAAATSSPFSRASLHPRAFRCQLLCLQKHHPDPTNAVKLSGHGVCFRISEHRLPAPRRNAVTTSTRDSRDRNRLLSIYSRLPLLIITVINVIIYHRGSDNSRVNSPCRRRRRPMETTTARGNHNDRWSDSNGVFNVPRLLMYTHYIFIYILRVRVRIPPKLLGTLYTTSIFVIQRLVI